MFRLAQKSSCKTLNGVLEAIKVPRVLTSTIRPCLGRQSRVSKPPHSNRLSLYLLQQPLAPISIFRLAVNPSIQQYLIVSGSIYSYLQLNPLGTLVFHKGCRSQPRIVPGY